MTGGENDQPPIEEVLASIRSIIADKHRAPRLELAESAQAYLTEHGEPDDFELPAMFRPERAGSGAQPSGLVARLTGAIRGGASPAHATRGAAQRESGGEVASAEEYAREAVLDARASDDVREGRPGPLATPSEVARVMVPLKDTLMARMGQTPQLPSTMPAVALQTNAPAYCYGPLHSFRVASPRAALRGEAGPQTSIPRATIGSRNYLIGAGALDPAYGVNNEKYLPPQLAQAGPAPFKPRSEANGAQPGAIDASTAELLRPLLKQWLDDNVERVFSKALHSEADACAKSGGA